MNGSRKYSINVQWNLLHPVICDSVGEAGGCSAKKNKPDQERQVVHGITYTWNLKKKVELLETESGEMVIRN